MNALCFSVFTTFLYYTAHTYTHRHKQAHTNSIAIVLDGIRRFLNNIYYIGRDSWKYKSFNFTINRFYEIVERSTVFVHDSKIYSISRCYIFFVILY